MESGAIRLSHLLNVSKNISVGNAHVSDEETSRNRSSTHWPWAELQVNFCMTKQLLVLSWPHISHISTPTFYAVRVILPANNT